MRLVDVYQSSRAMKVLWQLLGERDPKENISHKVMPTWEKHCQFVLSRPYAFWALIECDGRSAGAIYLTHKREIGIGILKEFRRRGFASQAIKMLMEAYPGACLANINPQNLASVAMFRSLGFHGPIQETYQHG